MKSILQKSWALSLTLISKLLQGLAGKAFNLGGPALPVTSRLCSVPREGVLDPTAEVQAVAPPCPARSGSTHSGYNAPSSHPLTLEGDARVVDQHVEAPVLLMQEVAQGAYTLQVSDVQLVETGAQALRLQLLHSRPTPRLVPRREHHVPREPPTQVTRDGKTEALVGPSDQRHAGGGHGRCAGPLGVELTRLETDGVARRGTWRPVAVPEGRELCPSSRAVTS